nr:hypothetical protein CFP56_21136 [Quercus suber]
MTDVRSPYFIVQMTYRSIGATNVPVYSPPSRIEISDEDRNCRDARENRDSGFSCSMRVYLTSHTLR